MKNDRGTYHAVRHEERMLQTEDAYRPEEKIADPATCPLCKATYIEGRWTWRAAPVHAIPHTCPACQRIADDMPAGYVTLKGDFLAQHHDEVINLVRAREAHARAEHPLQRIMAIEDTRDGTHVTTTDPHLARGIAHALRDAFKGDVTLRFARQENLVRATWTR